MAFTEQTYFIKGEQFRLLHNTDNKEIWVQHLPDYAVVGIIATKGLHIPAGQQGHEDMADFVIRLKLWLNTVIAQWFSSKDPVVVTQPLPPVVDPMDKQIDDLIVSQLSIVGDQFV